MPEPVDIDASTGSSPVCSVDADIQERVQELLCSALEDTPSRVDYFDIWHSVTLTVGTRTVPRWVRVTENILALYTEKHDRWYQETQGVFHHKVQKILTVTPYDIEAKDVFQRRKNREAFSVIDFVTVSGITEAMLNNEQFKFTEPPPGAGTMRLIQIGGIVG